MTINRLKIHGFVGALFLSALSVSGADSGVEATSIRLSADAAVTGVWIDGRSTPLGAHSKEWASADEYGPCSGLRCIAISAESGGVMGRTGFIGVVVLKDGQWVVTDPTWRAWKGEGEPPVDVKGRPWTAPDYDDHSWPLATEIGPYGMGPWGTGSDSLPGKAPESKLDAAMRQTPPASADTGQSSPLDLPPGTIFPRGTNISTLFAPQPEAFHQALNADWIWAGPPLGGAVKAFFRKDFAGNAGVPPSQPQGLQLMSVTPTSFTIAWQPVFFAQGPVRYELAWNGQVMLTTSDTQGTIGGITINPVPQNYAWVQAVAPDGSRSAPSSFVLIATSSKKIPGAPAHLRVTARSQHGLSVAWDPAQDEGELDGYNVLVNNVLCTVPPGVCSATVSVPEVISPGTALKVDLYARDIGGKSGPAASVEDWTLPPTPIQLPTPSGLRLDGGKLSWDATPGASSYRLWRDGVAVPGNVNATTAELPKGEANGFVRIAAIDGVGNTSPLSETLVIGHPSKPEAPIIRDGGHSGELAVLRWTRPATGTCIGYRVEKDEDGAWMKIGEVDDPWQNEFIIGDQEVHPFLAWENSNPDGEYTGCKLEPGTSYRFRVVALTPDKGEVASAPFQLTTVAPPSPQPRMRFAVIISTDGKYDYLDKSLADADNSQCTFALIKGQIVPQLSSDPKLWDSMMEVVRRHRVKPILALLASKDGWSEINDSSSGISWKDDVPILGRYDMAPWRTGQPLDQLNTELGGALRMAGFVENPRGNTDFLPDLEHWIQDAEADNTCRWFFTGGVSTESAPTGIPRVILELYKPSIDFMRMTNGNPGHELALDPGSAVACASPQRNRAGGYYLVTVEDKRLVFESRQYNDKRKSFITDGLQEIDYDRDANLISAANLRIPYPDSIATGLPQRIDHAPPWTQNRILNCSPGAQVEVRLLGRSPRGAPLNFTVTRQPANGTLSGTGDKLVYRPASGFKGEDFFLYRADDGGAWPGNTAWVRINVGDKS